MYTQGGSVGKYRPAISGAKTFIITLPLHWETPRGDGNVLNHSRLKAVWISQEIGSNAEANTEIIKRNMFYVIT